MLDYDAFKYYLADLPFQTNLMVNKNMLHVDESYNDEIVSMSDSTTSYVDSFWFKQKMNEKSSDDTQTFPVVVKGMKINWFVTEKYG